MARPVGHVARPPALLGSASHPPPAVYGPAKGTARPASAAPGRYGPQKGVSGPQTVDPVTGAVSQVRAQPEPLDPALEQQKLIGARNVALAGPEAAYQTGQITQDFGIDQSGQIDTSNPYSRAAMLQLSHDNAQNSAFNSFGAQGQQGSSAYQSQRGLNDQSYSRDFDTLQRGAAQGFHGVQSGLLGTYANAGTGVAGADFQALLKKTYG